MRYRIGHDVASYVAVWPKTDGAEGAGAAKPQIFNHAVRRDPLTLILGDAPRFAPAVRRIEKSLNPPWFKLGDLRLGIDCAAGFLWLDQAGCVQTEYFPWGARYEMDLAPHSPTTGTIEARLLDEHGVGVRVALRSAEPAAKLWLCYGGVAIVPSNATTYLVPDPDQERDNELCREGNRIVCRHPAVPSAVTVDGPATPVVWEALPERDIVKRAGYVVALDGEAREIALTIWIGADAPPAQEAAALYDAAPDYYRHLLADCEMSTPVPELDAAFYGGIVNLDYSRQGRGYLEGVQCWSTYWAVNYQVSAAVALGKFDEAREALLFLAGERPGEVLFTDGSPVTDDHGWQHDALPYFIIQLHRYWEATRDRETVRRLWDSLKDSLNAMLTRKDPAGTGFLSWHSGCNSFLYQADALHLPGAGFSPSAMLCGMLRAMADLGGAVGDLELAGVWRGRADTVESELLRRFWLPEEGRFTGCIDPQGLVQQASYYTDFVFPSLYTTMPADRVCAALRTLDETLWADGRWMRVGNFKPGGFGNDAILPTQMCEAAEAYFKEGRSDRGLALLASSARAATTHTRSPGAFPERCDEQGNGEANYIFGNPIGAYLQALIGGLFGLRRAAAGSVLHWTPCIPPEWTQCRLRVGAVTMAVEGAVADRTFSVTVAGAQPVALRVPLHHARTVDIRVGDASHPYRRLPHPEGDFALILLPAAATHRVVVRLEGHETPRVTPRPVRAATPAPAAAGPCRGARVPVDLTPLVNSSSLWESGKWPRRAQVDVVGSCAVMAEGTRVLDAGEWGGFAVAPGENVLVVLDGGHYDWETNRLLLNPFPGAPAFPRRVVIPIGRRVRALDLLCLYSRPVRLTGMEIGEVVIEQADGSRTRRALRDGVDLGPGAGRGGRVALKDGRAAYILNVPCRPDGETRAIEIAVLAVDAQLGLIAANTVE